MCLSLALVLWSLIGQTVAPDRVKTRTNTTQADRRLDLDMTDLYQMMSM